jgi:hypothetical protein
MTEPRFELKTFGSDTMLNTHTDAHVFAHLKFPCSTHFIRSKVGRQFSYYKDTRDSKNMLDFMVKSITTPNC